MRRTRVHFLDKLPQGPDRSITVNGTIRSEGGQDPWSNGFAGKGTLGTRPTTDSFHGGAQARQNRTGEDKPRGF